MILEERCWPPNNPGIFPPSTLGFALALCGAANVIRELISNSSWLSEAVQKTYIWLALGLIVVNTLRSLAYWRAFLQDISTPNVIPNYAAGQMALLFLASRLLGPSDAAFACVYALSVVQLLMLALFLQRCWVNFTLPEPFWNPPTVNCAVTTIVAAALGMPTWLIYGSFWFALLIQFIIVPFECYRVMFGENDKRLSASIPQRSKIVANNISVALLQAPCSLTAVAWGAIRRLGLHALPFCADGDDTSCGDAMEHLLFACAMLVLALTGNSLWQRRTSIYNAGFSPAWAATTFPTCSSAIAALQYSGFSQDDPATPASLRDRRDMAAVLLRACAAAFATATSMHVLAMVVLFLRHQAIAIHKAYRQGTRQQSPHYAGPVEVPKSRSVVAAKVQVATKAEVEAQQILGSKTGSSAPAATSELQLGSTNPITELIPRADGLELVRI